MYDTLYRLALEVITMQVVIIKEKKCSSIQKYTLEMGKESANNTVYFQRNLQAILNRKQLFQEEENEV